MRSFNKLLALASMVLALGAFTVPAAFAAPSESSPIHLSTPLDVGGTILEPGDYVIHVLPSDANSNLLRVTSPDGSEVFTTVLSIPHARGAAQEEGVTSFVYYPTVAGAPQALRTWFASESTTGGGHDIVYPRARALELAAATSEPILAYTEPATADDLATAEVALVTPENETVPYTPEADEPVKVASTSDLEMPQTAGTLPLAGALGLLLLLSAVGIHVFRVVV